MQGRLLAWSLTAATILALVVPAGAQVAAPEGLMPIVGDVTFSGGTFVLRENLVVGAGSSLTFRDAVVYLDAPTFCPTRGSAGYCQPSILLAGGTLRILDSVIDNHAWNEHDFESGWSVAGNGVMEIRDSTLTHYKSIGVQLPGHARSAIAGNAFAEARGALSFIRGAEADVTGNTFEDVYMGVSFLDSDSTLVGNVFRAVGRDYGAGLFGRAIDVQSTLVGEKRFEATTLVQGNLVEDAVQGMLNLNGFPNEIRDNVFRANQQALTIGIAVGDDILHSDAPLVEGNLFDANVNSIQYYTSGTYRDEDAVETITSHVHQNSFLGTACIDITILHVDPHVQLTIDARHNWWGSAAGPQDRSEECPATVDALVEPWLMDAP